MCKCIFGHKKNPSTNSALHEGSRLLIYEHFKAQTRGKTLTRVVDASVDTGSSSFSSDMDDVQSISSEDEEDNISSGKKANVFEKKSPSLAKAPCRKSPKGLGLKLQVKEMKSTMRKGRIWILMKRMRRRRILRRRSWWLKIEEE